MVRVLLYNCLTAVADNSGLPDELVRLRKARGLTQEDVIERAQYPGYPRLEQGTRNASRRALLLIGSDGFHLADAESFDRLLQSAGFPPVTDEEIKNWRIVARPLPREMVRPAHPDPQCLPVVDVPEQQIETENAVQAEDDKLGEELHDAGTLSLTARQSDRSIATVVIWALTAIACAILSYWIETLPAGLIAVLCVLYAALFPVSLFLETAYHQPLAQTGRAASIVFCGILLTTMVVFLAVDRLGSQYPLPAFIGSVFIFAGSAFVQWFSVRNMLSERRFGRVRRPCSFQPGRTLEKYHLFLEQPPMLPDALHARNPSIAANHGSRRHAQFHRPFIRSRTWPSSSGRVLDPLRCVRARDDSNGIPVPGSSSRPPSEEQVHLVLLRESVPLFPRQLRLPIVVHAGTSALIGSSDYENFPPTSSLFN